ncbi:MULTISPECIES: hypothetical protein [Bacillus]|nr:MULTISPECIES: hypothetical protein [Bacillus]MCI3197766.1 hypothetical protein [Bacillus sp. HU-1818]MED4817664.1 hypothetical protein [Bacillus atrophaeus]MED4825829.1 hypothetical protein [Bacillus atrophaeus]MED4845921.1 hypothetical protein [Bacillus atrophaeus]MED4861506.1 hypothetical protein [Bacillus atrophaeus]
MTIDELYKKYNLQNCTVKYRNEPNLKLMAKAFMDFKRKLYLERKKETAE